MFVFILNLFQKEFKNQQNATSNTVVKKVSRL